MRRRNDRIHITTTIERYGLCGITETAALHDTLTKAPSVRRTHEIRNLHATELAKPIVYPLHGVPGHVADIAFRLCKCANLMRLVTRIVGGPAIRNIPYVPRHEHPFRLGREPVSISLGAESKAVQPCAMTCAVKDRPHIGIGSIEPFRLAALIRIEHRIIEGHVRCGQIVATTIEGKPRRTFRQGVKLATRHLVPPDREFIVKKDFHFRTFVLFRIRIERSHKHIGTVRLYPEHPRQGIYGEIDRSRKINITLFWARQVLGIRARKKRKTEQKAHTGNRFAYTQKRLDVELGSHVPKIDYLKCADQLERVRKATLRYFLVLGNSRILRE